MLALFRQHVCPAGQSDPSSHAYRSPFASGDEGATQVHAVASLSHTHTSAPAWHRFASHETVPRVDPGAPLRRGRSLLCTIGFGAAAEGAPIVVGDAAGGAAEADSATGDEDADADGAASFVASRLQAESEIPTMSHGIDQRIRSGSLAEPVAPAKSRRARRFAVS